MEQEKTKVSYSEIRTYKSCRRKYFFSYIEGLKPKQESDALVSGSYYHKKLEALLKDEPFDMADAKTTAMAFAFDKYIRPSLPEVIQTEKFFSKPLGKYGTVDVEVIGYIDGICKDGTPIEHKSTSFPIDEAYQDSLWFDEQIPVYMWAENVNEMWYTVCKKPNIRQTKRETEEEFAQRCIEWYDTDTEEKIAILKVCRTREDINEHMIEIMRITNEMRNQTHFFRNPYNCNGFMSCPYRSICLNYDPLIEPIGFEKTVREKR
jgi:hypothetical protein